MRWCMAFRMAPANARSLTHSHHSAEMEAERAREKFSSSLALARSFTPPCRSSLLHNFQPHPCCPVVCGSDKEVWVKQGRVELKGSHRRTVAEWLARKGF